MGKPVEPPSTVAIARELCKLAATFDGPPNSDRECLLAARKHLDEEPPDFAAAAAEISAGMAHAFRGNYVERRPETWLLAACAMLLKS